MADFNEEYIRNALAQGRSIEDIGNEFAKLLNDTDAKVQEEKKAAHEAAQRKAIENQKRMDIYDCVNALVDTLAWYYPMYEDCSDEEVQSIVDTLIASCDLLSKLHNSDGMKDLLDVLGIKGADADNKGGDVSFDKIVKSFLGE